MTTTPDNTTTTPGGQIDQLEAAWAEPLRCEITTNSGHRCRRPAVWRVDVHGCEKRLTCTGHVQSWERKTVRVVEQNGRTRCGLCGRFFTSVATVYRTMPL